MMINSEVVREFVESNPKLVSKKETHIPGVYLLKYKNRVFYDNLWNDILTECRGTLVDENYHVIARPFTKIFNHHENGTTFDRDDYCTAFRKVNGFMAAISVHNTRLIVSTTGSTDSEFVVLAREMLMKHVNMEEVYEELKAETKTVIVEIVHPSDPHIIPEEEGVYFLGARFNKWGTAPSLMCYDKQYYRDTAYSFGMKECDIVEARFSDICDLAKHAKHEGYVVYNNNSWRSLKIKSPYYLMAKFLARKNEEKLIKLIDNPHEIKKIVDEEYYEVVDAVCENKQGFISMNEQERLNFIRYTLEKQNEIV